MNSIDAEGESGTDAAIRLRDVCKRYGKLQVLDGLSLTVRSGEVYGFLGRNGAGKSTAIRLMMGIAQADSGSLQVLGEDVRRATVAIRRQVGYVAQQHHFYPWMTPLSLGRFVSRLYPGWSEPRYRQLLHDFELPDKRKLGTFSGGMTARLALSLAIAHQPRLLILDEPTAGMDPVARREFLDIVSHRAGQQQLSVLFSTHVIDDIEAVADRIGIVEAGRNLYEGDLATFAGSIAGFTVAGNSGSPDGTDAEPGAGLPLFLQQHGVRVLQDRRHQDHRQLIVRFADTVPSALALPPGWQIQALSMEDRFVACIAAARARAD